MSQRMSDEEFQRLSTQFGHRELDGLFEEARRARDSEAALRAENKRLQAQIAAKSPEAADENQP